MTRLTIAIAAITTVFSIAPTANAQKFVSQTRAFPGYDSSQEYWNLTRQGKSPVGKATQRTVQGSKDRYRTIFTPQDRQTRVINRGAATFPTRDSYNNGQLGHWQDFYPHVRNYNYQNSSYRVNHQQAQKLQQLEYSVQNFAQAVQQLRYQRQLQQYYQNNYRR